MAGELQITNYLIIQFNIIIEFKIIFQKMNRSFQLYNYFQSDFFITISYVIWFLVCNKGKYDKTSHLRIQLVSEADAGEFLCVASNSAGLVQINLTLDVETLSPVASGLDAAQITGLGVALLILLTIIVALLLLAALRRRDHTAKDNEKV